MNKIDDPVLFAAWVDLKTSITEHIHDYLGYGHEARDAKIVLTNLGGSLIWPDTQGANTWPLFGRLVSMLGRSVTSSCLMVDLSKLLLEIEESRKV